MTHFNDHHLLAMKDDLLTKHYSVHSVIDRTEDNYVVANY